MKPGWGTALVVEIERESGYRVARLVKPLRFVTSWGYEIVVPAGFESDFVSVPMVLSPFVSRLEGDTASAAVLHDYLYVTHMTPRRQADDVFLDALTASRTFPVKRWLMWAAVRVFGGSGWNRDFNPAFHTI